MASLRSPSSPSDGYKRFSDDFANSSINNYGSNVTNNRAVDAGGGGGADGTLELGSRSSLHSGLPLTEDEHWEMNYHEAAIYLEEGLNNEKFDSHPSSPEQLPAYLRVHNPWYHGLDLLASLALILLAFGEEPAVPAFRLPVWAHGSVELLALAVVGVELQLKLKWIGWGTILKHKRTMIKGCTLLVMLLEAVVLLCRQSPHFRVTRALRPIFLVDTRHCGGVRRFIRQILQSLPPILDMLGLLMFFVATYSLLGYYLFSEHVDNGHFSTLSDSFVSMFVLLTTANFPDVMMPSYAKSKWYALFFVLYIITVLYVLMNLMLAVVYETFTRIERDKCRALLLHRRGAARRAFRLLVSRRAPRQVRLRHFAGLLRHHAPRLAALDVFLMFRHLNRSGSGGLSRAEFAALYDALSLRWSPQAARAPWYADGALEPLGRAAAAAVAWPYFEHLVYALIVGNGAAMALRVLEAPGALRDGARLLCASWDTWLFAALFLAEAALRVPGALPGERLERVRPERHAAGAAGRRAAERRARPVRGGGVPPAEADAAVQAQEALPRRVRHAGAAVAAHVVGGLRHAGRLLLLRDHRHGVVRGRRAQELLREHDGGGLLQVVVQQLHCARLLLPQQLREPAHQRRHAVRAHRRQQLVHPHERLRRRGGAAQQDLLHGVLPVHDGGADHRGGERAGGLPLPHPVQAQHHQERRREAAARGGAHELGRGAAPRSRRRPRRRAAAAPAARGAGDVHRHAAAHQGGAAAPHVPQRDPEVARRRRRQRRRAARGAGGRRRAARRGARAPPAARRSPAVVPDCLPRAETDRGSSKINYFNINKINITLTRRRYRSERRLPVCV